MKNVSILSIALLAITLAFFSCNSDNQDAIRDNAKQNLPSTDNASSPPADVMPLNSNNSLAHYICPNNCAGSGGAGSGKCPTCGAEYVHNQAYHNNPATPSTDGSTPNPVIQQDGSAANTQLTSPAQNAAGVYHYICDKGCAGGAAAAGNCATCGGTLTHNAAYHNQ